MSRILDSLRYSKDHEWVRIEGEKAYVGITDHAQDELGEIVFVELPPIGERYKKDEEISSIESVKAASPIINPIEGVVLEANEDLDGSPELINEDCYANHLYVLGSFSQEDYDSMMDSTEYASYLASL
ncbi:MAG TPA: glycine cleavage system protein GcvH [Sphaerochaeta sp.]|jgi:glycine cleavage system H protein|nr:glycine cleavage system protein GcvH [Spirochaetales bacterium]TAH57841.1 MAG: glycine cleavage system protein GcvH [Sphaerochaeta sp.]HOE89426.1 glycine cleavage system protein GcvH [Sphaerochaeta sp.]HOR80185.1 glycine cleavage system protein GcvH [Sphaerochaeta sp.]HPK63869.1 glycine cleavage system protein GcvH [Sphaerochaeta sp.]